MLIHSLHRPDGKRGIAMRSMKCTINEFTRGVNIYPQDTEDVLITYPGVTDVRVSGLKMIDDGLDGEPATQCALDRWRDLSLLTGDKTLNF